jgi:hypothetical protein
MRHYERQSFPQLVKSMSLGAVFHCTGLKITYGGHWPSIWFEDADRQTNIEREIALSLEQV